MIGLYVQIGRQRSKRFEIAKERVTIGSDATNDLVLRDGGVAPFHGALVRVHGRWFLSSQGEAPGAANRTQPVEDGAAVRVGDYTVVLAAAPARQRVRAAGTPVEPMPAQRVPPPAYAPPPAYRAAAAPPAPPPLDFASLFADEAVEPAETAPPPARDPVEQSLIDAIVRGDEDSRLVYADWLETRGDAVGAEFLRLQRSLAAMEPTDPAQRDLMAERVHRLGVLARQVDFTWRREIGRPVVEGCDKIRTDFQCKMDWGSLAPTEQPNVRRCQGCGDNVYYVATIGAAREHVRRGHCIVVDFGQGRRPNDLEEPLYALRTPRAMPMPMP